MQDDNLYIQQAHETTEQNRLHRTITQCLVVARRMPRREAGHCWTLGRTWHASGRTSSRPRPSGRALRSSTIARSTALCSWGHAVCRSFGLTHPDPATRTGWTQTTVSKSQYLIGQVIAAKPPKLRRSDFHIGPWLRRLNKITNMTNHSWSSFAGIAACCSN